MKIAKVSKNTNSVIPFSGNNGGMWNGKVKLGKNLVRNGGFDGEGCTNFVDTDGDGLADGFSNIISEPSTAVNVIEKIGDATFQATTIGIGGGAIYLTIPVNIGVANGKRFILKFNYISNINVESGTGSYNYGVIAGSGGVVKRYVSEFNIAVGSSISYLQFYLSTQLGNYFKMSKIEVREVLIEDESGIGNELSVLGNPTEKYLGSLRGLDLSTTNQIKSTNYEKFQVGGNYATLIAVIKAPVYASRGILYVKESDSNRFTLETGSTSQLSFKPIGTGRTHPKKLIDNQLYVVGITGDAVADQLIFYIDDEKYEAVCPAFDPITGSFELYNGASMVLGFLSLVNSALTESQLYNSVQKLKFLATHCGVWKEQEYNILSENISTGFTTIGTLLQNVVSNEFQYNGKDTRLITTNSTGWTGLQSTMSVEANKKYRIEFYIKKLVGVGFRFTLSNGTTLLFNIATVTISSDSKCTAVGNGWYKFSYVFESEAKSNGAYFQIMQNSLSYKFAITDPEIYEVEKAMSPNLVPDNVSNFSDAGAIDYWTFPSTTGVLNTLENALVVTKTDNVSTKGINRNNVLTIGEAYKITFKARSTNSNAIFNGIGSFNLTVIKNPALTTLYQEYEFECLADSDKYLRIYTNSNTTGHDFYIKDLVVKEINPKYSNLDQHNFVGLKEIQSGLYEDISNSEIVSDAEDYRFRNKNIVVNGGFDTDTDWNKGTGWTISGGVASINNTSGTYSAFSQNIGLVSTKKFFVKITVTSFTSGQLSVLLGGANFDIVMTGTGTYSTSVFPAGTSIASVYIRGENNTVASIDNLEVYELDADENVNLIYAPLPNLASNDIKSLSLDHTKAFVGTDKGIDKLDLDKMYVVEKFNKRNKTSLSVVNSIVLFSDDTESIVADLGEQFELSYSGSICEIKYNNEVVMKIDGQRKKVIANVGETKEATVSLDTTKYYEITTPDGSIIKVALVQ